MSKWIQVEVMVSGRWIGWSIVRTAGEAQVEADRARRQGLEPRIGGK